ncbi:CBS domain-containing protein [Candidatus Lucifugimonas marina]|jgi:CBS domain-containing protein|uniref:CBS domain-containing protein n=1 Tax=Candidatus Lucifugimonas marina TaxID=3038979 RepID=A0AAJ6CW31_9CHLR|nr:CBS domain-containing protein [SAR202 cluster bacterium JH702]MDG0870673.1 CBS domain-containing protein [SAR202 cluster bacterium JH639]WFG36617.1 CBS domain-containing protein [SAR202 cluster bacterium JH545]WFG40550.1 CBS domain-containing protein [SAR202 cluster bacterium JH1073]
MLTKLAKEIMTAPVVTITADKSVAEGAKIMLERNVGSLAVVDNDGRFLGLLSESKYLPEETVLPYLRQSVLRVLGSELGDPENIEEVILKTRNSLVGDAMRKNAPTVEPETHLAEVAKLMVETESHHLPVIEDDKPVGMVSRHDLLTLFAESD